MEVFAAGLSDPAGLVFVALIVTALSGFPGLFLRRFVGLGQKIATLAVTIGCLLGISGSVVILARSTTETYVLDWTLPFDRCEIAIDPLSALFLVPVFLISACGALYARGYWPATSNRATEPTISVFFGLLSASMALLLMARNGVLFLVAWEVMAVSAYFLMVAEHQATEVRKAGSVYLVATHAGTLALFVMFSLLQVTTSSFGFPQEHSLSAATLPAAAIFITALLGFGVKAGIMPLHIWLPAAHANAPSHISAIMSGVMLKMGIYGIIRVISFFQGPPLWWGGVLLFAGTASALLGITFAIAQVDLKKLLAYSSIENIGIITMGMGVALIGATTGNTRLMALGMAGALLHVLNHSLFKSLLFMGAGAVIHATGTRLLDRMGGLSQHMPVTALCFLTGAVAICGLPPLNGFVSEFLLYVGFFSEARTAAVPYLAMGAPLLALIGGLAVICFVKVYGIAFLGCPRTPASEHGHESSLYMLIPMAALALLCLCAGTVPQTVVDLLHPALSVWQPVIAPDGMVAALPSLWWLTCADAGIVVAGGILALVLWVRLGSRPVTRSATWGCGYINPAATMQYTASSFGEMSVQIFRGIIGPRFARPAAATFLPRQLSFASVIPETLLGQVVLPCFRVTGEIFSFLRIIQMGKIHIYMLYIFVVLVLLLIWAY